MFLHLINEILVMSYCICFNWCRIYTDPLKFYDMHQCTHFVILKYDLNLNSIIWISRCFTVRSEVTCNHPWKKVHRGCYMFNRHLSTWYDAQLVCQRNGGYLASMSSKAEAVRSILLIRYNQIFIVWVYSVWKLDKLF